MRTNAPEYYHEVDGGALALLGSVVEVGPATVSSNFSVESISRDEEYELVSFDLLEFLRRWLRPVKVLLEVHLLEFISSVDM